MIILRPHYTPSGLGAEFGVFLSTQSLFNSLIKVIGIGQMEYLA
jgi:hypothetical protein